MLNRNLLKLIKSLEQKKYRQREGLFVAEGPKVVGDLMRRAKPQLLVATHAWITTHPEASAHMAGNVVETSEEELRRCSFLQHPQQVVGLFPLPGGMGDRLEQLSQRASTELVLALDGIQDPGNLGTIIRLADWFGIQAIVCSPATADAWSPKVVQATMGSIARVDIHRTDLPTWLRSLPADTPVYGTLLDGDDIYSQTLTPHGVIVMGNEGDGITPEVRPLISRSLLIPRYSASSDGAESLNVAIATAITCAEFRRRSQI